ncbi:MAG: response regulator transcription factor [Myxococcota bacterium]
MLTPTKKLLLVDDHPLIREGLRTLLERESDLRVCAEAGSIAEAMQALSTHAPDILLVDISLGGENGLDLISRVRSLPSDVPILVLSMHPEALYAERVLCLGANGYLNKQTPLGTVLTAIRQVLAGGMFVSQSVTDAILRSLASSSRGKVSLGFERLSNRELEVFRLVGSGLSSSQIADNLHISPKTVETHRARIKEKLGIESSAELVVKAATWVNARPQA